MEQIETYRTPEIIATEINSIKDQTRQIILCNSIEIGRRLVEAKSLLPHGEWGKWLESRVSYSQSTANNLMRIFEEYGDKQFALFGDHQAKSQALANLSYTQAVALLAIPEDEREAFVEEHDLENMSTRELQQAIKERDEAIQAKEEAERKQKEAEEKAAAADKLQKKVEQLTKDLAAAQKAGSSDEVIRLETELQNATDDLGDANKQIEELSKKLKETPIDVPAVVEKIPDEVQKELDELRNNQSLNIASQRFRVHFDVLVKEFQELLSSLREIETVDSEAAGKYKNAVTGLMTRMNQHLEN